MWICGFVDISRGRAVSKLAAVPLYAAAIQLTVYTNARCLYV